MVFAIDILGKRTIECLVRTRVSIGRLLPLLTLPKCGALLLLIFQLASTPAMADPGLGSLQGLWIVYLIGFVLLLAGLFVLAILLRTAFKLINSENQNSIVGGRFLFGLLALIALAVSTLFVDFSFYFLRDNHYPNAVTITRSHVERYMETDDGRVFYLKKMGLSYFKPGRKVVLQPDTSGRTIVYDIFEATRTMYHQRTEKKLWIPIIPTIKDSLALSQRGPVATLDGEWRFDTLVADLGDTPIPWCCEVEWVRLMLDRGADPNLPIGRFLPLASAVVPLGWQYKEKDIKASHAVLDHLVSVGIDINAHNNKGNTALHLLAMSPHKRSVAWLLAHGANPALKNDAGNTPTDILVEQRKKFGGYWGEQKHAEYQAIVDLIVRAAPAGN